MPTPSIRPRELNLSASRRSLRGLDATKETSVTDNRLEVKAGCVGQAKDGGHADCLKAQLGLVRRPVVNGWKGCSPPGWGGFGKNAPNPPEVSLRGDT